MMQHLHEREAMRPKIICHMISSIDGRLLVERWTAPAADSDADLVGRVYEEIASRLDADGWLVGRKAMEVYATGEARSLPIPTGHLRDTYIADRKNRDLAIAVDPHGKLHYGRNNADGSHFVAILGEQVPDAYLAELRENGVSYLFAGPDGHDLHRAMDILGEAFGAETILLEGGGIINGAFLQAGLIDEISLLIYPGIDGLAGIPSIFEYVGGADDKPAAALSLRHTATETLDGGIVWLRYRVEETQ